ncbi:MAG: TonB-dependent receptor [Gammaproteobacteria bacterium]|nr:TonB-dependent receptor [Gammaproteobacteria bacterium]
MKPSTRLRLAVALGLQVPFFFAFSPQALAQDTAVADNLEIEEIISTGTRARARSVEDSPAPVDVLSASDFTDQGDTDLSNLLRTIVPSYNVNTQPISDAATIVRPANLRGLAPDHTLVLINGKRRHRAAVIYWLGNGISNGAQGPDISMIPAIALKRVEVLRDGAAAQYGSDAIAGVMNFILKDEAEGGSMEVKYGEYAEGDGALTSVAGNIGLPFSSNGFANASFEYSESDSTDRSVQRDDAAALIAAGNTAVANPAQIWGSPEITDDLKIWLNMGLTLNDSAEFYAFGNFAKKHVDGGFFFRNPDTRSGVFATTLANPNYDPDTGTFLPGFENEPTSVSARLIGDVSDTGGGCGYVPSVTSVAGDPFTYNGLTPGVATGPNMDQLDAALADGNCFLFNSIFPGGFTPRFGGDVSDSSLAAGVRGEMDNGLRYDVSASVGQNEVSFFIRNTVNASLGAATPTAFDPGAYTQFERNFNVDFGYSPTDQWNLAFGAEHRVEEFTVRVGQQESFEIGPLSTQGFSVASNGFPGFSNLAGGTFDRRNIGAYFDAEFQATEKLLLAAAIRYEDYSDFGTTTNGKIAANFHLTDNFGLRATASTGFKAPTPGQSNAYNVSTEFDVAANELVNNGTIPSTSPVAVSVGGKPLAPEESTNLTAGVFFNFGALDVTIDYFNIEVTDRLNLSQEYQLTQDQIDDLIEQGVTSAASLDNFRFFTNDFDTTTEGVDVVATYPLDWATAGTTNLTLAFNTTSTEVTKSGDTVDETRIKQIEEGVPATRWNFTANHAISDWNILARVSYFDDWYDSEDDLTYGGEFLLDAELAYQWNDNVRVMVGAQNLLDTYPEENPGAAGGVGNKYSQYSPFGFNGAFYYMRLRYEF